MTSNTFSIVQTSNSTCKKFHCEQKVYNIEFKETSLTFGQAQTEINNLFVDIHIKFADLMSDKDFIRITFLHDEFDHPIGYPFMNKQTLLTTNLQETFFAVTQSYKTVSMNTNNSLKAMIVIARLPSGSGLQINSQQEMIDESR